MTRRAEPRKARFTHTCDACEQQILPGEVYLFTRLDGEPGGWREHEGCARLSEVVDTRWWPDGLTVGWVTPGLLDEQGGLREADARRALAPVEEGERRRVLALLGLEVIL